VSSRAEVHLLKSEYAEARSVHVQLIDNTPQNNTYSHGFALLNLAEIDVLIGAYGDVLPNLDRATAIFQSTQHNFLVYCDMIRADFNLKTENKRVAKEQFHQCLKSSWNLDQQVVTYCLERLADISQWNTGDSDWVSACAVMYLVHAHRLKQKLDLHKALQFLGEMFIVTGDDDTAHNLFAVALEGFTAMDVHRSRARCLLRLGDLAEKQGNSAMASGLWREAQPLFEKSSQGRDVERIQSRLTLIGRPLVNAAEVDT
jgi:tetratricopeptide (TPR) repeat protein